MLLKSVSTYKQLRACWWSVLQGVPARLSARGVLVERAGGVLERAGQLTDCLLGTYLSVLARPLSVLVPCGHVSVLVPHYLVMGTAARLPHGARGRALRQQSWGCVSGCKHCAKCFLNSACAC